MSPRALIALGSIWLLAAACWMVSGAVNFAIKIPGPHFLLTFWLRRAILLLMLLVYFGFLLGWIVPLSIGIVRLLKRA
jgi:hypothetical protein